MRPPKPLPYHILLDERVEHQAGWYPGSRAVSASQRLDHSTKQQPAGQLNVICMHRLS